ncbi:hypothetical protein AMR41_12975 [Hapalosiphon sp. MRB220]|nr:hypothetical protein AMR41_12975 [Hapalosiphon sp. MRB220]
MTFLSRHALMRLSGNFCTGVMLLLATSFSFSSPILAVSNPSANTTTESKLKHKEQSRWIEIDLSEQKLKAWEGKQLIYSYRISTGKKSTPTPTGEFSINTKYRSSRMRGDDYDIPDVPYAMYFYKGYAIHGAYWHDNFGTPVSHGCVNLPVNKARKLYKWAGMGTLVVVHK